MGTITEWLALFVTFLGVISSGVIAFLVYRSTRQAQKAEVQREISSNYDQLMNYREKHPEVLALSRDWSEASFESIYQQATLEDKTFALYSTYAELCAGYCGAVLAARKMNLVEPVVFEKHYRPRLRLLITENFPYFKTLQQGKYINRFVLDFIGETRKTGWDWEVNHQRLATAKNIPPNHTTT